MLIAFGVWGMACSRFGGTLSTQRRGLQCFLTDELTLAVAIGREPNPLGGAQRLANGSELGGFVAALCRTSAVKAFGPQQDRRPALPRRHDIFRLEQVE